jgi:rhodanese-related sulfurtransferase
MKPVYLAAVIIFAATAFAAPGLAQTPGAAPAFATVSSETFHSTGGDTMLVDVREPSEWAQTGAPTGAKLISNSREDFVSAVLAEVGGDKSKPVAVICRSGARSVAAAKKLTDAGFTNVTNVGDGMIGRDTVGKGWQAAELPLTPYDCKTC